MQKCYCDICGKQISYRDKVTLSGTGVTPFALGVLAQADEVCQECYETAKNTNWMMIVREAIRKE